MDKISMLKSQDALDDFPHLESGDSLSNGDKLARVVGEHLGDLEGLGQESLNLPRPRDLDLVLQVTSEDR